MEGSSRRLDLETGRPTGGGSGADAADRNGTFADEGVGTPETLPYTVDYGFRSGTKQRETPEVSVAAASLRSEVAVNGRPVSAKSGRLLVAVTVAQSGSGSASVPAERWRLRYDGAPAGGARSWWSSPGWAGGSTWPSTPPRTSREWC